MGSKRRIKLIIEYDGTHFYGWQVQAATGERTVQGVLETALAEIPGARPKVFAAGRTDKGVHALAMTAHYNTEDDIPEASIARALNARLPADVRVLQAQQVERKQFHAQYTCCYRRYCYRMRLTRGDLQRTALDRHRVLFLPQALDVPAMQRAAGQFVGKRDFAALATQETRTTIREVYLCALEHQGRELNLHVAADGFLRNMVRAIVGTLLYVGEGKLRAEAIPERLAKRERRALGPNAPPHGLYFAEAGYQPWSAKGSRGAEQ